MQYVHGYIYKGTPAKHILYSVGKDDEVRLSFPPYGEIQEIVDGKQASSYLSSTTATPLTAPVTGSGNTPTTPLPFVVAQRKKPGMAPVFMGTALLEQQRCTLHQQPQQPSATTALPLNGGTLSTLPQRQHSQTSVIPQTHLSGTSQYQ